MKRRQFMGLCLGAVAAVGAAGAWWRWKRRQSRRRQVIKTPRPIRKDAPNIVVILIDDLGYGDVGYHPMRSPDVKTPNIDALADSGTWFSAGYTCSPVCSPSRAGLLTGMYPQRCGFEFNVPSGKETNGSAGLPVDVPTLAERLRSAGYATGIVGKWHLGAATPLRPNSRGFDEFFGFISGSRSYWAKAKNARTRLLRDEQIVSDTGYLTDTLGDEAAAFIERHKDESFFLYMALNAVHSPYDAPPQKYLDRFKDVADATRRTMLAITSAMDDAVGQVMGKLRAAGIEEKTLVFFLSDNGGTGGEGGSHNGHLRRGKGCTFEGGVRVPFVARWPGKIKPGKYDRPVSALDIAPTALAVAGIKVEGLDGVNLLPYLSGDNPGQPHESLLWRYGKRVGIRKGQWKWVDNGDLGKGLYDLDRDPGETSDLSVRHPEVLQSLQAQWKQWSDTMKPPAWEKPVVAHKGHGNEDDEEDSE